MPPKKAPKKGAKGKGMSRVTGKKGAMGFTKNITRSLAGTEDCEVVNLAWEYILSGALTTAAEVFYAIKGNSIYQPGGVTTYGLGLSTNPVGYARLYTQYRKAIVVRSTCTAQAWGSNGTVAGGIHTTAPQSVPLRLSIVPCDNASLATYTAANTASMGGYPHGKSVMCLPGTNKSVASTADNGLIFFGNSKIGADVESTVLGNTALTGADPSSISWSHLVGLGNPSTILSVGEFQLRFRVVYRVKFFDPVAAAIQVTDVHGNEPCALSSSATASGYSLGAGLQGELKALPQRGQSSRTETESKAISGSAARTQEEAFEDWSDADSEFATFKEQCLARRRAMRKIAGTSSAVESKTAGSTK